MGRHVLPRTLALLTLGVLMACGSTDADGDAEAEGIGEEDDGGLPLPRKVVYGDGPDRYGLLTVPEVSPGAGPLPVVVLVHGGFWKERFRLDLMSPLADDLAARGYAVWNIEYRRVGGPAGGGVPDTLDDIVAAFEALADEAGTEPLDLDRVAVVGHSAGGHLALWAADRVARPVPRLAIGLAAVIDLEQAAADGLGSDAVAGFLGGPPSEVPERLRLAQPVLDGGRTVLVHGTDDDIVPLSQSEAAAEATGAELHALDGTDHFDVIDPTSEAWAVVVSTLEDRLGSRP